MNIKISIKDCECNPTIRNSKQISQVQHKKKTMLYAPPQRDKKINKNKESLPKAPPSAKKSIQRVNSEKYREAEKQMLDQLKKNGRNHATLDMIQNSNNILQRQNQILADNQRTLNDMAYKNVESKRSYEEERAISDMKSTLDKLSQQMNQMRQIRDDIKKSAQEFNRNLVEFKGSKNIGQNSTGLPQMTEMNSNLKDLVQISKNQVQGLQNLEALKNLQNFNIENYTQAINSIKRQIAQYQKQSQNIQRQLKIRAAKLQKLEISPKFQQELYKPYQEHLNNRINSIDLYSIREKVYDKLGAFDYGKFQYDIGSIMCEAKGQLSNFSVICKEHQIRVPDIKLDMRELKQMDVKTPSVLDEYKATHGIVFERQKQNSEKLSNNTGNLIKQSRLKRTNHLQQRLKTLQNPKKPQNIRNITSKPIDKSTNIKLTRESDKGKTILENQNAKQKKAMQERLKKTSQQKKKEEDDFQKYLENRAKQQLQLIYKQRNQRLKRMQQELQETCQEPLTFIQLNLDKNNVQNKNKYSPKKNNKKQEEEQYEQEYDQFEKQQVEQQIKKEDNNQHQNRFIKKQSNEIRQATRDILKQKLKSLLKDKAHSTSSHKNIVYSREKMESHSESPNHHQQVENMTAGFINLINNSLNQINANLASVIEKRVANSNSQEKRAAGSLERKQARRIQIPKLQQCRPPPVFNVNLVQPQPQPQMSYQPPIAYRYQYPPNTRPQIPEQKQKKIEQQDYTKYEAPEDDHSSFMLSDLEQSDI